MAAGHAGVLQADADGPGQRSTHLAWLLALPPGPAPDAERAARVLAALDDAIDRGLAGERLLRRSPNVVPRLVNALRNEGWNRREVVEQIQRDPVLSAETLRLARSALYAHHDGEAGITQAVDLLGAAGLKQVVARVLVRPLFQAEAGSAAAGAASRIWETSDFSGRLAVALAREEAQAVDAVDACLAGLLQPMGWSAMLQVLDARGPEAALHDGVLAVPNMADALALRRDRLLAQVLPGWNLGPALNDWARTLGSTTAEPHRLGLLSARAEALARLRTLAVADGAPAEPPAGLPPRVARVWADA